MTLPVSFIYILITGFAMMLIVFGLIAKQNAILVKGDKRFGYVAYNHSRSSSEADAVMAFWQQDDVRVNAVRNIVYLDYVLMALYGLTILYGLVMAYSNSTGIRKVMFGTGIILIIAGVVIDAIQDYAIYQHLARGKHTDVRYLTTFKFSFIVGAFIILLSSFFK